MGGIVQKFQMTCSCLRYLILNLAMIQVKWRRQFSSDHPKQNAGQNSNFIYEEGKTFDFSKRRFTVSNTRPPSFVGKVSNPRLRERIKEYRCSNQTFENTFDGGAWRTIWTFNMRQLNTLISYKGMHRSNLAKQIKQLFCPPFCFWCARIYFSLSFFVSDRYL